MIDKHDDNQNIDLKDTYNVINSKQQTFNEMNASRNILVCYEDTRDVFVSRKESVFPMETHLDMGNNYIYNVKTSVNNDQGANKSFFIILFYFTLFFFILLPQQVLTYIVVYTYSKIKSHKKSYKIFDFKSRDSTFYKAIEKRGDVSSMQLICMTKQRKQILPPKAERYETRINK